MITAILEHFYQPPQNIQNLLAITPHSILPIVLDLHTQLIYFLFL